ncbi:MAG: ABC transporter ATP-binding protein [Chthonomonadales bacterium]|nr:ABC transporter ATP-binding protein [Chthonomonadales bacterium]
MISLQRASRWYGQVIGINDVTCAIGPGITALLGPNGAGKSTLIKLVTGQLRPTTGRVTVLGANPFANTRVFGRLGYGPEIENAYEEMTGRGFVTLLAALAGIPSARRDSRVADVLEMVGMAPHADRRIGGYSKGMRQRVKFAQAIVHDPEVLVLDEPLNGLDPLGRREMAALFQRLAAEGRCVLVSSHILYEVEQLTHTILLMHRGRLRAQGDVAHIRSLIDAHPHHIQISTDRARDMARRLLELPFVLSARLDSPHATMVEIETRAPELFYDRFPSLVLEDGFVITDFRSPDNNLEAVFRYLVADGSGARAAAP